MTTRIALGLVALVAAAAALPAQGKKALPAKVRLAGDLDDIADVTSNGKSSSSATFTTPGGVKFELKSASSLSKISFSAIEAKTALITEQTDALFKLIKDKKLDAKARKKATEALKADYELRGKGVVVVEGGLSVIDRKARLAGTARLVDPKKADKDLPPGGAMVEGEAEAGQFAYGKDKKATLAIKNGDAPILLIGKAVGDKKHKGKLRVYGHLKQGARGALVLEATKIEEVK